MIFSEVQTLQDLDHPGIMKIHEIYQETDKLVMIVDYVPGGTLY